MNVTFSLPIPPPLNHAYRTYRGRICKTAEAMEWQRNAALIALDAMNAAGESATSNPVALFIHLRHHKAVRGDIDGRLKLLLDALQHVCYDNDRQVVELYVRSTGHEGTDECIVMVQQRLDTDVPP